MARHIERIATPPNLPDDTALLFRRDGEGRACCRREVLGELTGEIRAAVPGDRPLVVYSWPLGREGRKAWGATAIANQEGEVLAVSHSLWITLKKTDQAGQ